MNNKKWPFIWCILLVTFIFGVSFDKERPTPYQLKIPEGWPEPVYSFENNPLTEEGVALGRQLFYDPLLSRDQSISCGNCHLSFTAFSHIDHAISHGVDDRQGTRNSLALMNLAWNKAFMWDGAINHLDMQALAPITSPTEMDEDLNSVLDKLRATAHYPMLFQRAFGYKKITGERFLKALAQFQLTLISADSKYDKVMRKEEDAHFTAAEAKGYKLFRANCSSCHPEPLFTTGEMVNNGLPVDPGLNDLGRMNITDLATDSMKFKIPTLRNVYSSGPYMHDGRFWNLRQVLDHYVIGVEQGPTLDARLEKEIRLSEQDKSDLIAFLHTLKDPAFLLNPDFYYQKPR